MKPRRYLLPTNVIAVTSSGRLSPEMVQFLGGLEDVSKRVSAEIAPLAGGASSADVITKINVLIAAMQAAGLMNSEG